MYKKLQPIKRRKAFGVTVHSVEAKEQMHIEQTGLWQVLLALTKYLLHSIKKWQNDTKNWSHNDSDGELINRTYAVPTVSKGRFYM